MYESSVFQNRDDRTAEKMLWRAVIARTLEEWVSGPLRYSRIAEQFLFHDNKDFQFVCSSAGMDPLRLRGKLQSMRAPVLQKASGHTRESSNSLSKSR
jgi:hypothetical protein